LLPGISILDPKDEQDDGRRHPLALLSFVWFLALVLRLFSSWLCGVSRGARHLIVLPIAWARFKDCPAPTDFSYPVNAVLDDNAARSIQNRGSQADPGPQCLNVISSLFHQCL